MPLAASGLPAASSASAYCCQYAACRAAAERRGSALLGIGYRVRLGPYPTQPPLQNRWGAGRRSAAAPLSTKPSRPRVFGGRRAAGGR